MTENHHLPRVLALVPTWNAEKFIERTLDSLVGQTYPNLRVLISDDASTDNTVAVCTKFTEQDERFDLIRQPENLGWIGNANALLEAADADYLLFAFHDDVLLPDYISRCVDALEDNNEAIVAYSDMVTFYQDGDQDIGRCTLIDGQKSRVERTKRMLWRGDHWWAPNRGVFRAEAAELIGGMKRNLAGEFSADWPWLVHMMLLGEAIRIPEVLVEKYYEEHSVSRGWNYSSRHQLAVVLACAKEIHNARLKLKESLRLYVTLIFISIRLLRDIAVVDKRAKT